MDRYPKFFEKTFLSEGYFQNSPNDKGNWHEGELYGTICGITARNHFEDFWLAYKLYTTNKLELLKDFCMSFYCKGGYWNDLYNDIDDVSLAFKIWDFGINAGVRRAVYFLQEIIINNWGIIIDQDGDFGNITLIATNKAYFSAPKIIDKKVKMIERESIIYAYYIYRLEKYYRSLWNFKYWGKNWIRRLKEIFNELPDRIRFYINPKK